MGVTLYCCGDPVHHAVSETIEENGLENELDGLWYPDDVDRIIGTDVDPDQVLAIGQVYAKHWDPRKSSNFYSYIFYGDQKDIQVEQCSVIDPTMGLDRVAAAFGGSLTAVLLILSAFSIFGDPVSAQTVLIGITGALVYSVIEIGPKALFEFVRSSV